jgi:glycosyltransferase involved in cell wall biosynthesis
MSGKQAPTVALVTTVFNEEDSIDALLDSVQRQSRQPDQIIIVDGGSSDGTRRRLESWSRRLPITWHVAPAANISQGRNLAIRQAGCDVIAVTDAGVRLDPLWLERIVAPLIGSSHEYDVSAGFFIADPRSEFEVALAATTLPDADEIDEASFLPSSRSVAFRKSWFDAGIQYPEWLDFCEDLVFDLRLQRAGARFRFEPGAVVQFRPRNDLLKFWRQYYRYARGDGKAGLFFKRHVLRYATYFAVLPSMMVSRSLLWRVIVLAGAVVYMRQPIRRLSRRGDAQPLLTVRRAVLSAALRGVGDLAKMAGYPAGLLWRARTYGLRKNWKTIPERRVESP